MGFLMSMNNAVRGKKLSSPCDASPVINSLLELLDTLSLWIDEIPPVDQPQRFGNKAFRDYYARLKEVGLYYDFIKVCFICKGCVVRVQ